MSEPAPSAQQLLARAAEANAPAEAPRCSTDRWMPTVAMLRHKGWSYAQIYRWLKEQGEPVQPTRGGFSAAVSQRYRRLQEKTNDAKPKTGK